MVRGLGRQRGGRSTQGVGGGEEGGGTLAWRNYYRGQNSLLFLVFLVLSIGHHTPEEITWYLKSYYPSRFLIKVFFAEIKYGSIAVTETFVFEWFVFCCGNLDLRKCKFLT